MRVIKNPVTVTIRVKKDELFEGKYLYYNVLTHKLRDIEKGNTKLEYKTLRQRLYNSRTGGKYNFITYKGLECLDVTNPNKAEPALRMNFEVEE